MRSVEIPEGVNVEVGGSQIKVSGSHGELVREFNNNIVEIQKKGNNIVIQEKFGRKAVRALVGTFEGHIKNMVAGVKSPYNYTMKVVSAHFPMNVKVQGDILEIANFLGEKHIRKVSVLEGVKIQVKGDEVVVSGPDKEKVGLSAGRIEKLCHKGKRDVRRFQDGIYLVSKK